MNATQKTDTRWDFAIVGGGIAGLAIAEMLQRSGASVILLEKNKTLCAEASAEQQGWFHTGALYTALPSNFFCRTMVGNLDDLVDYYSDFSNMNLRVEKRRRRCSTAGHWKSLCQIVSSNSPQSAQALGMACPWRSQAYASRWHR